MTRMGEYQREKPEQEHEDCWEAGVLVYIPVPPNSYLACLLDIKLAQPPCLVWLCTRFIENIKACKFHKRLQHSSLVVRTDDEPPQIGMAENSPVTGTAASLPLTPKCLW